MSDSILVLVAVGGGLACMALAIWLWRRGEPPAVPPVAEAERRDPQDELGTVVIPKEDLFSSQTVYLNPSVAQAVASAEAPSPPPSTATEFVPREEIFRVADRVRAAEEPRPEPEASEPPAGTEFIPREQLMAIIGTSRSKQLEPSREPERPRVYEPVHVAPIAIPEPPPAPEPAPRGPDISLTDLTEHYNASIEALGPILRRSDNLNTLVSGPLAKWISAVELLGLASERSATELLLPALDDANAAEDRRVAAALLLLHMRGFDGPSELLKRATTASHTIITAIEHWDSVRIEALLEKALVRASEPDKPRWWQVYWRRAIDPGSALVTELLESKDPARTKIGLELLCVHPVWAPHAATVDRHTFSTNPEIKLAALRAGLVLGRPSAAVVCKQAARDAKFPEACLLHAVLANDKEFAALVEWGSKDGAPPHAGWALGYSGRRAGIEACLALLQRAGEHANEALAGFRAATGFSGPREEASAWWAKNQAQFAEGTRYLRGRAASLETTKLALREADARLWHAYRLELLVRSKAEVRIPAVGMPDQLSRSIDAVGVPLL